MKVYKNEQEWKATPLWVRFCMLGTSGKDAAKKMELASAIVGLILLPTFFYMTDLAKLSIVLFFLGAYLNSAACRYIDNKRLWKE